MNVLISAMILTAMLPSSEPLIVLGTGTQHGCRAQVCSPVHQEVPTSSCFFRTVDRCNMCEKISSSDRHPLVN